MRFFRLHRVRQVFRGSGCIFLVPGFFEIMQPPVIVSCPTIEAESGVSASDDQSDVERVLAGDISAFEGIVRRWQGPLVNLAYRALAQWRKDAVFSTWLFALATNLYRSELRRIPARTVSIEDIPEPADARVSDRALEESTDDRDLAVRRAVGALPSKYREALILFYFHDMDVTTAARSLGLPEGTVKARLFRGREILRSKLPQLLAVPRLKEA